MTSQHWSRRELTLLWTPRIGERFQIILGLLRPRPAYFGFPEFAVRACDFWAVWLAAFPIVSLLNAGSFALKLLCGKTSRTVEQLAMVAPMSGSPDAPRTQNKEQSRELPDAGISVQLRRFRVEAEEISAGNVDNAWAMTMNKRTFIRLFAAAMASPVISPLLAWASQSKLRNWAGNLEYSTQRLYAANSLEQVRSYVKKQSKLKVLGTRHCFNNIADSTHSFLSLKSMDEVVALEPEAHTVTVGAGTTYGQLSPYLHSKGFALHNLASLPHISIAGACSTATHGSGTKNGNLATAVSALEFVTAEGEVVKLSRQQDGEAFRGAVVGLGALGVITRVTLDIQPTFMMRQYVYENLPLTAVKDHFDAIESSAYSVSLFTDWQNQRINEVWIKSRVDEGRAFDATPEFFGAKLATRNLHPIAELSAENCTQQMGVLGPWYERLPHFRIGFTPSAGKELQSEYFVPYRHAVKAILAIERLRDQVSPQLMISEIRTIAADTLWLSPCYEQPCVTIHFTWKQNWPAVKKLLPAIENELAAFGGRPHWGKLFTISPAELRASYKRLPDFIQLSKKFDPKGKFRNEFLDTNIFSS